MNLNTVLHCLTDIGPDRYPMSRTRFINILTNSGLLDNNHRLNAIDMLLLAGHIEYVIDSKHQGSFLLARPHLRPRLDGNYVLAGARSPNTLDFISADIEAGTTWSLPDIEIIQPDIAVISRDKIEGIDKSLVSELLLDFDKKWDLPPGNLSDWERSYLKHGNNINGHPANHYHDDTYEIFNSNELYWKPVNEFDFIFDHTGPLFLIRKPTYKGKQYKIVKKNRKGTFTEYTLPAGLDHQRWARLMILASYGVETIQRIEDDLLETRSESQLPSGIAKALVDITGRVPSRYNRFIRFYGVNKKISNKVIRACIETFTFTNVYHQIIGGIT